MLLAFGSNGQGQLSLGHDEDTHIPTPCLAQLGLPPTPPKSIVAGGNHTLLLFPCGTLFAAGSNKYGQCGIWTGATGTSFLEFQRVPSPPEGRNATWDLISAGWDFSILVSKSGVVYSCGQGNKGELGLGDATDSLIPQKVEGLPRGRVVAISSGMAHTVAILTTGEVYGWGAGRKGQLGAPSQALVSVPRKIAVDFKAAEAACGREFTFIVSANGGRHAVLGSDKHGIAAGSPKQGELVGWQKVSASWHGAYVLLSDGRVRAWGRNDRGQLPPAGLDNVQRMAIGSEHGLALVRDPADGRRRAVAWGWGEHGNCGKGKEDDGGDVIGETFEVPTETEETAALIDVGAGCATSFLVFSADEQAQAAGSR